MKVLVTGAAGFIGSHVAEAFHKRGDTVIGIDNLNDYYDPRKKIKNMHELLDKGIKVEVMDICHDRTRHFIIRQKPDIIVHIAAMAGVRFSIQYPEKYVNSNIQGTMNMLNAARLLGIHCVIASSSSIYGERSNVPFNEADAADYQISPYAATKRSVELLCHVHNHMYDLPVTCLRFFTVYGPRGRPDMAPLKFMHRIINDIPIQRYGDGSTARDYTFIADIVQGVVAAADRPNGFKIYNLGNSSPVKLNEFIRTIEEVCGKRAIIEETPTQPGDVSITYADINKAKVELDYNPKTPLKKGLKKQYEWYMKNR